MTDSPGGPVPALAMSDDAATGTTPSVSIVVPTFREAQSLPNLVERLAVVRAEHGLTIECIIVDDDSRDGTVEFVASLDHDWVHLVVRTDERGLSSAVLRGLERARHEICVVMDADLSHPPEAIPRFVEAIEKGADFVVGSRYIEGASTQDGWGVLRWINSKIATIMARPFTRVSDPMSGYLAFRRATWLEAVDLDPIGYKIGLELIVKCGCRDIVEVPIHFSTRVHGESKLSVEVQWQYLVHIVRLLRYRHPNWSSVVPFLAVGGSGFVLYAVLLWLLMSMLPGKHPLAVALAILGAMTWNFLLNRVVSFWYARDRQVLGQFAGYVLVCSVGGVVNWLVTQWAIDHYERIPMAAFVGTVAGVLAGTAFNYLGSRYLVFRRT